MNDLRHNRRQVLTVIIGGVATALVLPGMWTKPIINSMMAPAHASASPPPTTTSAPTTRPPTTAPPTTAPPTTAPPTTPPPTTKPPKD